MLIGQNRIIVLQNRIIVLLISGGFYMSFLPSSLFGTYTAGIGPGFESLDVPYILNVVVFLFFLCFVFKVIYLIFRR